MCVCVCVCVCVLSGAIYVGVAMAGIDTSWWCLGWPSIIGTDFTIDGKE